MHPYLVEELARAHMAALRDAADEFRRGGPIRRARRRRAGRLARTPRARMTAPAGSRG